MFQTIFFGCFPLMGLGFLAGLCFSRHMFAVFWNISWVKIPEDSTSPAFIVSVAFYMISITHLESNVSLHSSDFEGSHLKLVGSINHL